MTDVSDRNERVVVRETTTRNRGWLLAAGGSIGALLGVLGLSAVTGHLDFVLLPALAFFLGLTVYAFWRKQRNAQQAREPGGN